MTGIQIIQDGNNLPDSESGTVATIGVFDGVHAGHQALLALVVEHAKELGLASAVVTFDKHPTKVTSPQHAPKTLTELDQKLELFYNNGIEYVYLINFDKERSKTLATRFFQEVFVEGIHSEVIYVGEDFQFGYQKEGDLELLRREGEKIGVTVNGVPLKQDSSNDDEPISSTVIREHLEHGDIELANRKLGRLYECRGQVASGDGRGRAIGFPTANLAVPQHIAIPAEGVYAAWFFQEDGTKEKAAVNIGRRPTFKEDASKPVIEAHLLDFEGDLYGKIGKLHFVKRIRQERKFSNLDEFQGQLREDLEMVRAILS